MQLALFCEEHMPYSDSLVDIIETINAFDQIECIVIPGWSKNPKWLVPWLEESDFTYKTVVKTAFFLSDETVYYGDDGRARKLFAGRDFKVHVVSEIAHAS